MKPFNSHGQSFTDIPLGSPDRSSFNKNYTHKSSGRMGKCIPFHAKEVLPAEQLRLTPEALLRFEPLAVPMLSSCHQRLHGYVVPNRQVWSNWETFITRGKSQTEDLTAPYALIYYLVTHLEADFGSYASSFNVSTTDIENLEKYRESLGLGWSLYGNTELVDLLNEFSYETTFVQAGTGDSRTPAACFYQEKVNSKWIGSYNRLMINCSEFTTKINGETTTPHTKNEYYHAAVILFLLQTLWRMRTYYFIEDDGSTDSQHWHMFPRLKANYVDDIMFYELSKRIDSLYVECSNWLQGTDSITHSGSTKGYWYSNISARQLEDLICRVFYEGLIQPFLGESSNWAYIGYAPITLDVYKAACLRSAVCTPAYAPTGRHAFRPFFFNGLSHLVYNEDGFDEEDSCIMTSMAVDEGYRFESKTQFTILPLRALYRIWWYNYRDQRIEVDCVDPDSSNFKADVSYNVGSIRNDFLGSFHSFIAPDLFCLLVPRYIAWTKDTFTTATLNSFNSDMIVPLGDDINVPKITVQVNELDESGNVVATDKQVALPQSCISQGSDIPRLGLDGLSLSMLRKCQALANWLDKNMFLGYQYADQLYSHYGVRYSDARLQIPEYIGGDSQTIGIEIITNNTNVGTDSENLVDVAGRQSSRMQGYSSAGFNDYFSEEHAWVFVIMSVLPEDSYPNAIDRSLLMSNTYDVAFPEFAQTGSDIVATGEVAFNPLSSGNDTNLEPFGYQGRYYHYKSNVDRLSGNLITNRKEFTFGRFFVTPRPEDLYLDEISGIQLVLSDDDVKRLATLNDVAYKRPTLTPAFIHCLPDTYMFVSEFDDQFVFDSKLNDTEQLPLPVADEVL